MAAKDARLLDLKLGKAARRHVTFERVTENGRRTPISVLVEPLTIDEMMSAQTEAELLAMALVDVDAPGKPWATAGEIKSMLTQREIKLLVSHVHEHRVASSPHLKDLGSGQFVELLDKIADADAKDMLLGYRAQNAKELFAFYGEPASKVTDGQVMFYLGLARSVRQREEKAKRESGGE